MCKIETIFLKLQEIINNCSEMDISRTHEDLFESIENSFEDSIENSNMPRVLKTLQSRLWALKISGCKLASFKSVMNFFRKRIQTKKSAKKQGYRQMYTEDEIRYIQTPKSVFSFFRNGSKHSRKRFFSK